MKTIKEVILEVANSSGIPMYSNGTTIEFLEECIARIDAERGKDAVAWISDGFVTTERSKVNQWLQNGYEVSPLFLSPTTPEGMALVPKSAMLWLNGEGDDFEQDRPGKFWWRSKFRELLAAAQGERDA